MEGQKTPRLIHNWLSTAGATIAGISVMVILFFLILGILSARINPYVGILIYIVLPSLLVLGMILIPAGMFIEWRKRQRTGLITYQKWPDIDLNNSRQRKAAMIFLFGTLLFALLSSVGMYQAYHYTESIQFCGLVCHRVMKPEFTAYQDSPHARVRCVDCHIGPGAGWYAKSKLSGLYQVYAVLANVYPRPIPTPIENLRPAQETCETCHWPRAFFGAKQKQFVHFRYDKANSPWMIDMLVKIGGGNPKTSLTAGIHWHMNIAVKVEYIARDERRQDIPWIRVTDKATGRVTVYQDQAQPLTQRDLRDAKPRRMDCMDCHNRPSHDYRSPDAAVDLALLTGQIDAGLPEIKNTAVQAMVQEYRSDAGARRGIADSITDFYRLRYPRVAERKEQQIRDSIIAVQNAYDQNIFPFMRADWSDYPNDIGHFTFRGCMRCHDGIHASASGTNIPNDCRTCHVIIAQGPRMAEKAASVLVGLDFRHPVDIGDAWKAGRCFECHSGTRP
jgi:nitrate/TMAO reductase-like tetraheme cytochrome c subunit